MGQQAGATMNEQEKWRKAIETNLRNWLQMHGKRPADIAFDDAVDWCEEMLGDQEPQPDTVEVRREG